MDFLRTLGFLLLASSTISAQITIESGNFPVAGDTLFIASDNLPNDIQVPSDGEDQFWQLGSLQAPFAPSIVFRSSEAGLGASDFPESDIVANLTNNLESYYKLEGDRLIYLGTFGEDPAGFGVDLAAKIEPGLIERKAPLSFGDTFSSSGSSSITLGADQFPEAILEQLPIVPDSIRIGLQITRESTINGWGTINIPDGQYEVLKEERTETSSIKVEAKISILPWQDITGLIPNNDLLGDRILVTHHFLSNEAKEPIAIVYQNQEGDGVQRVEFKAKNDITTSISGPARLKPGVFAYPNPAIAYVKFEFKNLTPGKYTLKIFDILASEVWEEQYNINGNITFKADISHLKKGTYLYSLIDESGRKLVTRRLVVLLP